MGVLLSNEKSGAKENPSKWYFDGNPARHRRRTRYLRVRPRKSSKSGRFWTGKLIPSRPSCRLRNDGNIDAPLTVSAAKPKQERVMYIGLGGILILILILWLLGVI
jgi:hypothetical protein